MIHPNATLLIPCRYFSNGAQINSPIDVQIAKQIERNLEPWPTAWDAPGSGGLMETSVYNTLVESYCNSVCQFAVGPPVFILHVSLLIYQDFNDTRTTKTKAICVHTIAWGGLFPHVQALHRNGYSRDEASQGTTRSRSRFLDCEIPKSRREWSSRSSHEVWGFVKRGSDHRQ